ncbi:MAG: DNA-binding protein [Bdellovibrionales bacterium RIFOXYB2_FULL_36_6]|nr:MAG: DNA-binding protein [Bdellovibrionales bacterium RIFOXYB2_FULL_36_6]
MSKNPQEWLKQADYDIKTAEIMFDNKRYFYAVFMCHLSIEKALKGIYLDRLKEIPPKTHNLVYLVEKIKLLLPENLYDSVFALNRVSVPTRYPDDIQRMLKDYNEERTKKVIESGKEVLQWLKKQL